MQCILFNIVFISIVSLHVGQEKYHWIKMFSLSRCPSCPQWFSSTGCVNATGDQQMEIIFAITFRLLFFSLIFCFSSFIDFKFSLFFHLSLRFVTRIHNSWIFGFCFSILYLFLFFFVFLLLIFHYSQVYNPSSSSCTKFVKIFVTNPLFFFFWKNTISPQFTLWILWDSPLSKSQIFRYSCFALIFLFFFPLPSSLLFFFFVSSNLWIHFYQPCNS